MSQNQAQSGGGAAAIPVSEVFWGLASKADKKFSKIRDIPYYQRARYDAYFRKVFKVYTHLWKFQQESRQKLVEAGLKRWEIGDIASRIGQLYFGHYMRTSEASYLSECYIFYDAILTREYFKDSLHQDVNLAIKQLRLLSRFLTVSLLLNRRQMVYQLVNLLKVLLDECRITFQETDFKEWKLVVQDVVRFLKVDTAFMNHRPLRYSIVLDLHPDSIPQVTCAKRKLRLRDALLCSYHPDEVKFSEFSIDTFRMLQTIEWEPSGYFYQVNIPSPAEPASSGLGQNGVLGSSRVSQDMTDPTLPPNPRKVVLSQPSVTHLLAVLGTTCEELPADGILLIYLSAPGFNVNCSSSPSHDENSRCRSVDDSECGAGSCLRIGSHRQAGMNQIYPSDILPFTRRPLFLIIDSDNSKSFMAMSGSEKGERVALLLSPAASIVYDRSFFTSFLASPLQSFILLLGLNGSNVEQDCYGKSEKLIQSSLAECGSLLASREDDLDPVWADVLTDPFLMRLVLRFVLCRAVLFQYSDKAEFQPACVPSLPEVVSPRSDFCVRMVTELLKSLNAGETKDVF
ncbi:hypothetical protein M569_09174 [Genlisea aurea]|uniref:Protein SCAI n=1 Tax=Genlisea aurea TaxID=192259 RepID=S8CFD2_9LAMI|nr:hypothetical protein M569_09174 [Genlisea aurea]